MNSIDENLLLLRQWCADTNPAIYAALENLIAAGLITCRLESGISPTTGEPKIQVRFFTTEGQGELDPRSGGTGEMGA